MYTLEDKIDFILMQQYGSTDLDICRKKVIISCQLSEDEILARDDMKTRNPRLFNMISRLGVDLESK